MRPGFPGEQNCCLEVLIEGIIGSRLNLAKQQHVDATKVRYFVRLFNASEPADQSWMAREAEFKLFNSFLANLLIICENSALIIAV